MDERLCNEIAKELYAQLPLRGEFIGQEDVTGVTFAIAARLSLRPRLRAFRIEWAPDWREEPEADELISPDAATFHSTRLENW